jgi:hypothetical protein
VIAVNTITGNGGTDAIGLFSGARSVVTLNNVSGLAPAGSELYGFPGLGLAQIWLSPSWTGSNGSHAAAANDLVVCARRSDTVFDGGTANKVINSTPVPLPLTPQVAPSVRSARSFDKLNPKEPHLP